MSHEPKSTEAATDAVRPSWAAHELAALALTVVLAVWVVAQWGAAVQEALNSFGVVDAPLKRYRIPIQNAMTLVAELGAKNIAKEVAERTAPPTDLKLVEIPDPDFLADESELDDPALIAQGKTLFLTKICFTCHQTDPAVPAPAGMALKAPTFIGEFWGKERAVSLGFGGKVVKVKMDEKYFIESVKIPMAKVVKGALVPMPPPPPPITDEDIAALMAYVKSLSKPGKK